MSLPYPIQDPARIATRCSAILLQSPGREYETCTDTARNRCCTCLWKRGFYLIFNRITSKAAFGMAFIPKSQIPLWQQRDRAGRQIAVTIAMVLVGRGGDSQRVLLLQEKRHESLCGAVPMCRQFHSYQLLRNSHSR